LAWSAASRRLAGSIVLVLLRRDMAEMPVTTG